MFRKNKILILALIVLTLLFLFFQFGPKAPVSYGRIAPAENGQKILVVVAHPDDEIIGGGGYIFDAKQNGAEVRAVIVTNGDGNLLSAGISNKEILEKQKDMVAHGKVRMAESKKGLSAAGIPDGNIYFLSFPDRGLRKLLTTNFTKPETSKYTGYKAANYPGSFAVGAPYTGEELQTLLGQIVQTYKPDVIITHSPLDGYGDHRAVYEFVKKVSGKTTLYTFVVHFRGPEFPSPFLFRPTRSLTPPGALGGKCNWSLYPLSANTENTKYKEIRAYVTQLKDPGLYLLLRAFVRTNELFCVNP